MSNFEKLSNFEFGEGASVVFTCDDGEDIRADYEDYKEDILKRSEIFPRLIAIAGSGLDVNTVHGDPLLQYLQSTAMDAELSQADMCDNWYEYDEVVSEATEMWDYKWGHCTMTTTVSSPLSSVLGDVDNYTKLLSGWTASVTTEGLTISFRV